jgi:2-methylcitrate dehydratase PrpD
MGAPQPSLTASLAEYWAPARFEDLPTDAIGAAKRHLLDTLAAGVAGAGTEVVAATVAGLGAAGETRDGSAVLWGSPARLPPAAAALVNGTASHALEMDDFGGCGHSGAVVVPALCAAADQVGATGRAALAALVAGYDLAARPLEGAGGYRAHNDLGWHSTGTCGGFGAAAAVGKLLGLDAPLLTHALGIAGTFTGGIWAFLADGAMTKRFHPGKAAENGLTAAYLARAGMTGPRFVLEAEWGGFFSTYGKAIATPEATLARLGSDFRIRVSGIKPYSSCRGLHGVIDSLLELMAEAGIDHRAIAAITAHGNAQTVRQFARRDVATLLDAQFSLPYTLAVAAVSGRGTLDQYVPLRTADPAVADLVQRIGIVADRDLAPGENPVLELRLADGRVLTHQTGFARGAPERPIDDATLAAKAASLIVPILGEARFREISETIANLETLPDFRTLTALLRR